MTNFNWTEITNPKNPVFIIAEAGSNWKSDNYENDLKQAKKLIDAASESGANAIKFQTYRAETVYVSNAGNVNYLKNEKTMVLVGATPVDIHSMNLIVGRKNIAGSLIGGIKETQEMLDFCAEHIIVPNVEMINMQDINEAYTRIMSGDVKYRFVIDIKSLKQ